MNMHISKCFTHQKFKGNVTKHCCLPPLILTVLCAMLASLALLSVTPLL